MKIREILFKFKSYFTNMYWYFKSVYNEYFPKFIKILIMYKLKLIFKKEKYVLKLKFFLIKIKNQLKKKFNKLVQRLGLTVYKDQGYIYMLFRYNTTSNFLRDLFEFLTVLTGKLSFYIPFWLNERKVGLTAEIKDEIKYQKYYWKIYKNLYLRIFWLIVLILVWKYGILRIHPDELSKTLDIIFGVLYHLYDELCVAFKALKIRFGIIPDDTPPSTNTGEKKCPFNKKK